MTLKEPSFGVRPSFPRDPAFADAMRRAEEKARGAVGNERADDHVARTRSGSIVCRDGTILRPGPLYDADRFNALPLQD
jgi:hypothetical protein